MEIQKLSENIIFVTLSSYEPNISNELKELNDIVTQKSDCDIILDFSYIELINSSNISNLLLLRGFAEENGRSLILCNVQSVTKCIFVVAGLAEIFNFCENQEEALRAIKCVN